MVYHHGRIIFEVLRPLSSEDYLQFMKGYCGILASHLLFLVRHLLFLVRLCVRVKKMNGVHVSGGKMR